ncbi:MAG: hypothetical protein KF784_07750 [Fimbriimonadaceae bacterium]|nr:hypothetical protein [Fimbriimonadaceae bacterium]
MPKNQIIRWGIIGLIACVLLWAGNKFLIFVEPALPYAAGVALLMIVVGTFWEMRKAKLTPDGAAAPATETKD